MEIHASLNFNNSKHFTLAIITTTITAIIIIEVVINYADYAFFHNYYLI